MRQRQSRQRRIFLEPPPVPFIRKRLSPHDPHGSKQPPSANQPSLSRRPSHLLHRLHFVILKHIAMYHSSPVPSHFNQIVPEIQHGSRGTGTLAVLLGSGGSLAPVLFSAFVGPGLLLVLRCEGRGSV